MFGKFWLNILEVQALGIPLPPNIPHKIVRNDFPKNSISMMIKSLLPRSEYIYNYFWHDPVYSKQSKHQTPQTRILQQQNNEVISDPLCPHYICIYDTNPKPKYSFYASSQKLKISPMLPCKKRKLLLVGFLTSKYSSMGKTYRQEGSKHGNIPTHCKTITLIKFPSYLIMLNCI